MKHILLLIIFFATSILSAKAQAGANDASFNPTDLGYGFGDGADGPINNSVVQPDGKIVIIGDFNNIDGLSRRHIARLNVDGTTDLTFNPGAGIGFSTPTALALQADGKILIGGPFDYYNGFPRRAFARINSNGSIDLTYNSGGSGLSGASNIYSIAIQSDGKSIISGSFSSYNGNPQYNIARINTDGSFDATFSPGGLIGPDRGASSILIQPDGKIIIGGRFISYNSIPRSGIARLNSDGSLDLTFNPGAGANNEVSTTSLQSDGKIILGGLFTSINATPRNYIARINNDGSLDATFNPGSGFSGISVNSTVIQSDGKIIVGGRFASYNGTARANLARLNSDASLDATLNIGTGPNILLYNVAIQSDGKILVGGYFDSFNGELLHWFARRNADGTPDNSFTRGSGVNSHVPSTVYCSAIQSDGKIIIGGYFTSYNGVPRLNIARVNSDGSIDAGFNPGSGADGDIRTIAIQSDGKIIIAGTFQIYNGVAMNRIARLNSDGSLDATFTPGTAANSRIHSIAIQSDGKIIIVGLFTNFNGTSRGRIARLNTDGTLDATFATGTASSYDVFSVGIQADSKIIIAGGFFTYDGVSVNKIARLNSDGSLDASFNSGTGTNYPILATAIQNDGKIIIGGYFSDYNGISRPSIARVNTDGTLDGTFVVGSGGGGYYIKSIALQSDGKIIIGGGFGTYNGVSRSRLARINTDGTLDVSFDPLTAANNDVETISLQSNGRLIIGGSFTGYYSKGRNRIARVLISCVDPDVPTLATSSAINCGTQNTTLSINTGLLNSATDWHWYSGSCGGTPVGTGTSIIVAPTVTTTYYARGEGVCFAAGACASITITVNSVPTPSVSSSPAIACFGGTTTVTVSASGGTTPYTGDGTFTVAAGTYSYTVTDANSCTANTSITVTQPTQLLASSSSTSIACFGDNSTVTVSASGGTSPYTGTSSFIVTAGTYAYPVTDFNGCASTTSITITQPTALTLSSSSGVINCFGGSTSVVISASGGTSPYGGIGTFTQFNGFNSYTVTDGNGCVNYLGVSVSEPSKVQGTITTTPTSCAFINGTATVTPSGGVGGYTYLWSVSTGSQTTATATALSIGSHSVVVTDANGCSNTSTATITGIGGPPPQPGAMSGPTSACRNTFGIVYSVPFLAAISTYSWTLPPGCTGISTTNSITVAFGPTYNGGFISVSAVNICGTSLPSSLNVPVITTYPSVPTPIAGPANVCGPVIAVYSTTATNATSFTWTVTGGASILGGNGTNTISVFIPSGFTNGAVQVYSSNCIANSAVRGMIIIGIPVNSNSITGPTYVCPSTTVTYTMPVVPGATGYVWSVTAGATLGAMTVTSTTVSQVINFDVNWISGVVSVIDFNSCGTFTKSFNVYSKPPQPGAITGLGTGLCGLSGQVYSILPVASATSYLWTVPVGANIVGSATGLSITVNFTGGFTTNSGPICVSAISSCGASNQRCYSVTSRPANPIVTGSTSVCKSTVAEIYSATSVSAVSSWSWLVTSGASITPSGATAAVNFTSASMISAAVKATASNACGPSAPGSISVNVNFGCREASTEENITSDKLVVFPNPAFEKTTVAFNAEKSSKCIVKIFDLLNNSILVKEVFAIEGENILEIDLPGIAKGIYLVSVAQSTGQNKVTRLIVQ